MGLQGATKFLMAASLAGAALAWWFKDEPPDPVRLQAEALEEPKQLRTRKPAFDARVNGVDYRIQPRYSYDLQGVIVSLHHSDAWWDYAHKEWGDHVNVMDLCVVWGENVRSGAYRRLSYHNTQWECHWSTGSSEAWQAFNGSEVSNNHIVTDDPALARTLKKLRIGDQVRLRGYLVDYTTMKNGAPAGKRVSSEVRDDSGPGACEVLYVDSLDLLTSANRRWRAAWWTALGLLAASVVAWFFLPMREGR